MRRLIRFVHVMLVAVLALAMVSCGGSGGAGGTSTNKPKIRAFNIACDSNPLLIQLTPSKSGSTFTLEPSLAYLDGTTVFKEEKADTYDTEIFDSVTSDSLAAIESEMAGNTNYALVSYGLENYGSEFSTRLQASLVTVDLTAPVGNKANLIIFHGFNRAAGFNNPSAPAIDFKNPGDNPEYDAPNIAYGTSATLTVDSGSSLTFVAQQNATDQVFATSTPSLDAGGVYLAVVSGVEGSSGLQQPQITYFKLN